MTPHFVNFLLKYQPPCLFQPTPTIHRLGVSTAHASKQFCIVLILATSEDFTLPRKKTVGKKSGSHKETQQKMVGKELLLVITIFPP